MPEQMTIRERLEWLAGDRENRILRIGGMDYRSSHGGLHQSNAFILDSNVWADARPWIGCSIFPELYFLDESLPCTKLYRPTEKTELEKAEAELEEADKDMGATLTMGDYCAIHTYIEARLKVERLRAEESK